jgi:glutamyl-tRNA reductase
VTSGESRASLAVLGVSFHTAPLELRERLAYARHEVGGAISELLDATAAREGVLLSTCNRTEVYVVEEEPSSTDAVWRAWSARLGEDASAIGYVHRGGDAARHLFRVASGLDSMVVGEAQIQGQVRDALELCRTHTGAVLHRLFQSALLVAGKVRSETKVTRGAASVSSAAVQLAKQIFGSLADRRAMVLGAGETADLALECLVAEGVRTSVVASRTYERAEALAAKHGARAMHYDEAWTTLADVDLLLCSTASPIPIVTAARIRDVAQARGDRPLCVLDIAVPRDVDPVVREINNVFLYDLDDLHAVVQSSLERRRNEVPAAERLIEAEVARYNDWLGSLTVVPTLTAFRSRMDEIRQRELAHALRRLGPLSPAQQAAVEQLSRALMNKFMHDPTVRLRTAAAEGDGLDVVAAARYLFALGDEDAASVAPARERVASAGRTIDSGDE